MFRLLYIDLLLMKLKMQILRKPYPCLGFDNLNETNAARNDSIVIDKSYIARSISLAEAIHKLIKEGQEEICQQLRSDIAYGHTYVEQGIKQALAPVKVFPKLEITSSLAVILRAVENNDAKQI